MAGDDRMRELEERYEGYTVYDRDGDKIGKVDDLFVDETDREEYIGVKMGLFGLSGTTLIPMEMVRVDERERAIEVSDTKEHVKDAPNYSDDDEVNADFEDRIRTHFGMEGAQQTGERGSYGRYAGDTAGGGAVGGGAAASGAAAGAQSSQDDMRRGDRDPDDRYSGRAMGGTENRDRMDQDRMDQDRMDQGRDPDDRHSGAAMGGAEDRDRGGQESYRNREDMGSESAMGSAGAGGASASGGISDLETGDRGRTTDRGDLDRGGVDRDDMNRGGMDRENIESGRPGEREAADVGGMTRGHREGGDRDEFANRGDVGSSGQEMTRGDEGVQGQQGDESYRQGYREGLREGLREAGLGEPGGRGGISDRDLGASGSMRGSESAEGEASRGGGEYGGVGDEGMTGERGARETSADRGQEGTQEEEGAATRVWRRIRR